MADAPHEAPTDEQEIVVTDAMIDAGLLVFFGESLGWDNCTVEEQRCGLPASFKVMLRLLKNAQDRQD